MRDSLLYAKPGEPSLVVQLHASKQLAQVRKRRLLRHFMLTMIFLPRQARDKHRESTQKERCVFLQEQCQVLAQEKEALAVSKKTARRGEGCPLFIHEDDHFTKTGSGQTQEHLI